MLNSIKEKENQDLYLLIGEKSGDNHGSGLIKALKSLSSDLSIHAVTGPELRKCPVEKILDMEKLQAMGFLGILSSLPRLIKIFFFLKRKILKENPKAVIFIDYPDFHMLLQKALRKKGYKGKIVHYIAPSVWAWRKKRIYKLEKNVDLLLTIYPFEKKYFSSTKLAVEYIGNPLLETIQSFQKNPSFIGIFPGSRKAEIEQNLPIQIKACKNLLKQTSHLSIGISIADPSLKPIILKLFTDDEKKKVYFFYQIEDLIKKSLFAIATSGTITLQLALYKIPTIVTYAIKKWDLFLAKNFLKIQLDHFCIVNILLNKRVFPELFGPYLTETNLYSEGAKMLQENSRSICIQDCEKLSVLLKKKKASLEAAKKILTLLKT